uniref:N-acetyltransferase 14 (putative) n=1 Tax=Equus caballus TaxID=9796 RepID=F6ZAE4_HORSE
MAPNSVCTEKSPRFLSAKPVLFVYGPGREMGGGDEAQRATPQG